MFSSIIKTLLVALAAGASVQATFVQQNTAHSSSMQSSFNSQSFVSQLGGIQQLSSVSQEKKSSFSSFISSKAQTGGIYFSDVKQYCLNNGLDFFNMKDNLYKVLQSAVRSSGSHVKVMWDSDYSNALNNFNFESFFSKSHQSFYSKYHFDQASFRSVLSLVVSHSFSQKQVIIDLGQFRSLFGARFNECIPELQVVVKDICDQIGYRNNISFQTL